MLWIVQNLKGGDASHPRGNKMTNSSEVARYSEEREYSRVAFWLVSCFKLERLDGGHNRA
jgi:hypothetical protein